MFLEAHATGVPQHPSSRSSGQNATQPVRPNPCFCSIPLFTSNPLYNVQARRILYAVEQIRGLPIECLPEMKALLGRDLARQFAGREFEMCLYILGCKSVAKAARQFKKSLK
jgi:hypothetical protein